MDHIYTAIAGPDVKQLFLRKWSFLAGGLGFEPRFLESKSNVLPLDDPPASARKYTDDIAATIPTRIGEAKRLSYQ